LEEYASSYSQVDKERLAKTLQDMVNEKAEKFAEMLKYEVKFIPNHYFNIYEVTESINKVCKKITEGKV
jgi:hypothetical protein